MAPDRPAVLTPLQPVTATLLVSYGATDGAFADALTGAIPPHTAACPSTCPGRRTTSAPTQGVPGDDDPLYPFGHGLQIA